MSDQERLVNIYSRPVGGMLLTISVLNVPHIIIKFHLALYPAHPILFNVDVRGVRPTHRHTQFLVMKSKVLTFQSPVNEFDVELFIKNIEDDL